MLKIKVTLKYGRGVYTTKRIRKGAVVARCEVLLLSASDIETVNRTALRDYTFKYNDIQDCLVLGVGELFNHSNKPLVSYTLEEHQGRVVMVFRALRDIESGRQLFIDYSADTGSIVASYIENLFQSTRVS